MPEKSYVVCASQRSGTTMLCRALADTNVAGRPDEYFLALDEREHSGWHFWEDGPFGVVNGATSREAYLEIVYGLGTTANGVFGAKIMWNNLRWAIAKFQEVRRFAGLHRAEVFHAAFPDLHVIHVRRRDRVRQAVSWARMAQDGVWVVSDDEPAVPTGQPQYHFDVIRGLEGLIVEAERGWREFFTELEVVPYDVVYEELADPDGYDRIVQGALDHLGLADVPVRIPRPRTRRQADALNDEWTLRYISDLRARGA